MGLRSLVSLGFLLLPVAVTLGILLGLQAHREARGMPPPFVSNKVSTDTYCQRAFGISPDTRGLQYTCECDSLSCHHLALCRLCRHDASSVHNQDPCPAMGVELIKFAACS